MHTTRAKSRCIRGRVRPSRHSPAGTANKKYSWVKAPRFNGQPMQVGPLAQVLVGYSQGHPLTRKYTDLAIEKVAAIGGLRATPLRCTRHWAAMRPARFAPACWRNWRRSIGNVGRQHLQGRLHRPQPADISFDEIQGVGTHEAPRGTLSHWIVIKDEKIKNYQAVVPSTWNASPRDKSGAHGPYEASLLHTPLARPRNRWKFCGRCTRLIRAWRARVTRLIRPAERSAWRKSCENSAHRRDRQRSARRRRRRPDVVRLLESQYDFGESRNPRSGTPALDLTHQIVGLRSLILVDWVASDDPEPSRFTARKTFFETRRRNDSIRIPQRCPNA